MITTKSENEALKEKVDVLFKLGRSYINNSKQQETSKKETNSAGTEEEEADLIIDEEDDIENLEEWTKSKMRGFRRVDPTKPSTKSKPSINPSAKPNKPSKPFSTEDAGTPRSTAATGTRTPIRKDVIEANPFRGKFCHYFVNHGNCKYEERTGEKCKFEHKQAPMCNYGISCTRIKCMFTHPKVPGSQKSQNNNFLGQMMPQWNVPNPWMTQTPNPWNVPSPWTMKMPANPTFQQ